MEPKKNVLGLLLAFTCTCSFAQFENTMSYDSIAGSPKAKLEVIEWAAGHWRGEAFGGIVEEIWSPPLGGSMMGSFKLVNHGKVSFYELETIVEEDETLVLRLKHFDAQLNGWEEKNETIDFKLVKVTPNKVYFDGFTFERLSSDEINLYVVIHNNSGKESEVKFTYKRYQK